VRYSFIDAEKAKMPVRRLCRMLGVSRSGYYVWRSGASKPISSRARANEELAKTVVEIHEKNRRTYGRPRIQRALLKRGMRVGANRLRRIMLQNGIWGRRVNRRRVYGTDEQQAPSPNLLQRNFNAERPNQVWCGDITQYRIGGTWLYVATVIDLFSRRVVGLAFGPDANTDLTVRAMLDAFKRRRPAPGLIFHSDRGVQYRAVRFRRLLASRGLVQSMSRRGNCLDNAVAESLFATLEFELARHRTWSSSHDAELEIRNFIFAFYNAHRMHSRLEYLSPEQFEQRHAA
jgi:putative transposase